MFLIRSAFWISLVLLLLPSGQQDQKNVFGIVKATYSDIQSFCDRNRETCSQGRSIIDKLAEKAKFGAHILINIVRGDNRLGDQPTTRPYQGSVRYRPNAGVNTLRSEDLAPPWSFHGRNSGA